MKIKKIEKICKKAKRIFIHTDTSGKQWLGDGLGMFMLEDITELTIKDIFTMFEIKEEIQDKYITNETDFEETQYIFEIIDKRERLEPSDKEHFTNVVIDNNGKKLCNIVKENCIRWIDTKYITPLDDKVTTLIDDEYIIMFNETDEVIAVVKAECVFNHEFADNLQKVSNLTTLEISKRHKVKGK